MTYLILIKCVMATVERAIAHPGDAMDAIEFARRPLVHSICDACREELPSNSIDAGDILVGTAMNSNSIRCPRCRANFVHLKCALTSLSQVKCCSCGEITCCRSAELDAFIEQLRCGNIDSEDAGAIRHALDGLRSIGSSLLLITLDSYDMTIDELESLSKIVGDAGAGYQGIRSTVDQISEAKAAFCAPASETVATLMDANALAVALPILGAAITPHFIAQAKEEQLVSLIVLLAGYKGANADLSNALVKKIIKIINILSTIQFSDYSISRILNEMIASGSCAMVKHLVGRHRFGHRLKDDDACAIIEQYSATCTYSDETFTPLYMFLINGNIDEIPNEHWIQRLIEKLLQRDSAIAGTQAYAKLQSVVQRCESSSLKIEDAVASYAPDDGDFSPSEDLFCAITGTWEAKNNLLSTIGLVRDTRAAHTLRHVPTSWMHANADAYVEVAELAMKQKNFVALEEVLTALMSTRQSLKNAGLLFEGLLNSDFHEYTGLVLRIVGYEKFRSFKRSNLPDWLLKRLVHHKIYWCVPYFEGHVHDRDYYRQILDQHRQEIISTAVAGRFRFSPVFREIVRYDARNAFFVENLPEYFRALLGASADRYAVQRLLIEVCVMKIFVRTIDRDKIAAIYELFKTSRDCIFYLSAFYHALQHTTQKNCLKILIMDDLEGSATAKNLWAVASTERGVLQLRKRYKKCNGHKCACTGCRHCKVVCSTPFGDLVAALRYARSKQ